MKKRLAFLTAMVCMVYAFQCQAQSQNPNCSGLKNPQNFTLAGGTANAQWSGKTGTKPSGTSTCNAPAANLVTVVAANQLESLSSSGTCRVLTSLDIHGNVDHARRFVIKGQGTDPYTGNNLSYLPPDTSFHSSIRLGNFCTGAEAEALTYEFTVNSYNMLVTIWYALSLENALHSSAQNPEFSITVKKQVGNNWVLAAGDTLCYIQATPASGQAIAPFLQGASSPGSGNLYLPWTKVMINLSKLQYQRVRIELVSSDCSASGHYASSYFAGDCQQIALKANGCAAGASDAVARIAAPKGAGAYSWYRSKTGKLNGADIDNLNNYDLIPGATDSVLNVTINQFINYSNPSHPDTMNLNSFLCRMTTYMNPSYPVVSTITTDVGNTKPTIIVDSMLGCNADITLRDLSVTPYAPNEQDQVDSTNTQWYFYNSAQPNANTLAGTATGGTVSHTFSQGGNYCVRVRTSAFDTSCWNEKTVAIRTIKAPRPQVNIERNNLCKGDAITISDITQGSNFHEWTVNDSTWITPMPAMRYTFEETTNVRLRTRGGQYFMADTTGDGIPERVYCYTDTTFTIYVGNYPTLSVTGDTIVCNGDQSNVTVHSDVDNCRFDWYQIMNGTTPVVEDNAQLITSISQDRTYYVKATSPFGCVSWDSINLYLVKPTLHADKDRICTDDTVTLTAGRAATFEWTSVPFDPNLVGQEENAVIKVSPRETTTYSVVGHGTNGCGATALKQKVTVFPYPIQHVLLTPDYIDSENPSVQFADLSEYSTTSLWNFGNGNTSSIRTVVFTFSDLSQDSILVSLTTGNALGCTVDTFFYVPVGIFAVWFPNAFTPKLETNNLFKPFTANNLEDYELYIYDRNGILVFSTKDIEEGWNGTYNGFDCKEGAYVFITKYRRNGEKRILSQKGTFTLIR